MRLGSDVQDDPGGSAWKYLRVEEVSEEVFDTLLIHSLYPLFCWEVKPLCEGGRTFSTLLEGSVRGGG